LEKITRIFFNQRRKKIKQSLKKIFRTPEMVSDKLKINLNLRPQNLTPLKYYLITKEYEDLSL
jgi:16S rRNA (adenine1518-N6/adenine1519-N6)-dimethyltransferase